LLGFGQGQSTDAVNLFGDNCLTWLEISDHALQFWPISASPRRFLAIDTSDLTTNIIWP
jgi:hypothetical protein